MPEYYIVLCELCNRNIYTKNSNNIAPPGKDYGMCVFTKCKQCKDNPLNDGNTANPLQVTNVCKDLSLISESPLIPMILVSMKGTSVNGHVLTSFIFLDKLLDESTSEDVQAVPTVDHMYIKSQNPNKEFKSISKGEIKDMVDLFL